MVATKKGRVLGVSIVGYHAGELLMPWSIAISNKMKLSKLARLMIAYPTYSETTKQIASEFYKSVVFSPLMKRVVKLLRLL